MAHGVVYFLPIMLRSMTDDRARDPYTLYTPMPMPMPMRVRVRDDQYSIQYTYTYTVLLMLR